MRGRERFDGSKSKVREKEPSEGEMEWDGNERRAGWLQNRQKLHAALFRGTSSLGGVLRSASARRALTFARIGRGINTGCLRHSESVSRSITTHSTLIYDADAISLLPARRAGNRFARFLNRRYTTVDPPANFFTLIAPWHLAISINSPPVELTGARMEFIHFS